MKNIRQETSGQNGRGLGKISMEGEMGIRRVRIELFSILIRSSLNLLSKLISKLYNIVND